MHELLQAAWRGGYAVPSFCAWNVEITETVVEVAARLRAPVILMSGPGEFVLNSPDTLARIARAIVEKYQVAAEENVAALKAVVARARPLGVTVEGEIGCVGQVDDSTVEGSKSSTLTDPGDAARYAEMTGVDALAVSIGNAHGLYTRLPVFDFERLEAIGKRVSVPLVLHGGSGTQPEYLRRAISLGMAKINVASELCQAFRDGYAQAHAADNKPWLPMALGGIKPALARVVEKWIKLCGGEGQAP